MKGKMIIFIVFLTLLIGTAYAGNNTTEIEYDSHSIEYSDNVSYALESGDSNISFSNGYHGYCAEYREKSAEKDDKFYVMDTSYIRNNNNDQDVSNYIKVFFTYYYENTQSNNLTHRGEPVDQVIYNQHIIWYFTNNFTSPVTNNSTELLNNIINTAQKIRVPDDGVLKVNDTTEMHYSFIGLVSLFERHQNYFGYNITFKNITNHTNITTNNITENNTPYENDTITNNTIIDTLKHDEQIIKNSIVSLETNKKTGHPIVLLLTYILFIFIIGIRK